MVQLTSCGNILVLTSLSKGRYVTNPTGMSPQWPR